MNTAEERVRELAELVAELIGSIRTLSMSTEPGDSVYIHDWSDHELETLKERARSIANE